MQLKKTLIGLPMTLAFVHAGASTDQPKTFAVSAGWDYLVDSGARNALTSSGFLVEGSYFFKASDYGMPANLKPSLDFTYDRFSGNGNQLNQYALLLAARMKFDTEGGRHEMAKSGFRPYFGLGIGIVRNEAFGSNTITVSGQSGGSGGSVTKTVHTSDSNWNFAAKALIGVEFTDDIFLEAAYRYNGSVSGTSVDNISVTVGIRF